MAFQVALLEIVEPPKYQQIAGRALHLNQLKLSNEAIARHIDVDGKTVGRPVGRARPREHLDAEWNFL